MRGEVALVLACATATLAAFWQNVDGMRSRKGGRHKKRVSFSDITTVYDIERVAEAERSKLWSSPAELREIARGVLIEDWCSGWGS
ncbi:unnamed protein product [Choristocarpus tenellus]